MGDISGRPKAPSEPQYIYVPQYVSPSTPAVPESEPTPTPEQQREKSLLSRGRSRLGTILTGFRGILAPTQGESQRKTLLGE